MISDHYKPNPRYEAYMSAKFKKARNFTDCIWSSEPNIIVLCNCYLQTKQMLEELIELSKGEAIEIKHHNNSIRLLGSKKKFIFVHEPMRTFGYDRHKTLLYDVRYKEKL